MLRSASQMTSFHFLLQSFSLIKPKCLQCSFCHIPTPFLHKVTGFGDFKGLGTVRNNLAQGLHHRWPENRIPHSDGHKGLTGPFGFQPFPGAARQCSTAEIRIIGYHFREAAHAGLVANVRKRGIIKNPVPPLCVRQP